LLFAPEQSHQVQSEELDCSRGSGDFWEPPRDTSDEPLENAGQPNVKLPRLSSPLKLFSPAPAQPALGVAGIGGNMMFASGGGGGYDPDDDYDDFDDQPVEPERRPRATRSSRSASTGGERRETTGGRPRTTQFQPEERYWTDYLRIALPVIGLLLMIGLLWFWADRLINDDPNTTEPIATEEIGLVTTASPTPPVQIQSTPPPADTGVVAQETPAAGDNQAGGESESPPPADDAAPTEPPADTGATFADGDAVVVTEDVNLRPNPTTEGDPLMVVPAGEQLTITGGPEEGEDFVWWEVVTADGATTGWVVEDFLEPAE
jgi:hypothetical protein